MLGDAVRLIRDREVQRRILLAAMLLSGGAPFTGCVQFLALLDELGSDPPVTGLHDPDFHAGATVSVRVPAAGDNGTTLFARTGVLAPIDGSKTVAIPPIAGVFASGTASQRENIAVPLYGGVTVPAKNVGIPIPNLSFEGFAGTNIKNEKTSFALAAPASVSGSGSYTVANPAAGAGIQYYIGTYWGMPTSIGAAYIVDIQTADHTVDAGAHTFTNPGHIDQTAAFTLNFDINGLRPPAPK
jgi:hypothetical protein